MDLRRIVIAGFAAGAVAGLAAAEAEPAPLHVDADCDGAPELWVLACTDGLGQVGEALTIASLRDSGADSVLLENARVLAVDAAFACASAERWSDALSQTRILADIAAALPGGAEAEPSAMCAAGSLAAAEHQALTVHIDDIERIAARERLRSDDGVLDLPGARTRLSREVEESRCDWLAEAGQ